MPSLERAQNTAVRLLRWSEKYTKTDMVYLARTGFWGNAGVVTASLFGLALYSVFGHVLTQQEYGTYQYLLTLSVFIGAFTLTGMNTAVTRSVARGFDGTLREAIRMQLRWVALPLTLAISGTAYYATHDNYTIALGLMIIGITTPLSNVFNTYSAFLTGKTDFKRGFVYNFLGNIPYYGSIMICAYLFRNAIPILVANGVVNTVVLYIAYRRTLAVYRPDTRTDPSTSSYAIHLSAMNIPLVLLGQMENLLAFHFLGAAGLAIYSFTTAVPDQLAKVVKFVPSAALPKFSTADPHELRAAMMRRVLQMTVAGALLIALYIPIAPIIFHTLFPRYVDEIWFSQLYALSMLGIGTSILTTALMAHKRVRSLYVFTIGSASFQTIIQFAGVLLGGITGLIIAKLTATGVSLLAAITLFYLPDRTSLPDQTPVV